MPDIVDEKKVEYAPRKKYMRLAQDQEIEEFKKSESKNLTISPVSRIPRRSKSFFRVSYKKVIRELGPERGRIFIIKKNGVPISFVYETKPAHLKELVKEGVYKPAAMTAQVLAAMGSYRTKVLEKMYNSGIISNKYREKEEILSFSQKRVELLQPLERLINNPDADIYLVFRTLNTYLVEMENFKQEDTCIYLQKYDRDAKEKFQGHLQEDIDEIVALLKAINQDHGLLKNLLKAHGQQCLQEKLRLMMIRINEQAKVMNQNLTYGYENPYQLLPDSLFRGEFNTMCSEVMLTLDGYKSDLNNRVAPEHQGDFSGFKEAKIYLEFSADDHAALAAICKIEKVDIMENNTFKTIGSSEDTPLTVTRLMHWSSLWHAFEKDKGKGAKFKKAISRIGYFLLNTFIGLIGLIPDIGFGLVGGLIDYEYSVVEHGMKFFKKYRKLDLPPSKYLELSNALKSKDKPLPFSIFFFAGKMVRSVVSDVLWGVALIAEQVIKIRQLVVHDYSVGGYGDKKQDLNTVLEEFNQNIAKIQGEMKASGMKEDPSSRHFALPPYLLSAGEWDDVSVLPYGVESFGNTILGSNHYSSPARGLIYNMFYFAGLAAIFIPAHVSFPAFYKELSAKLGMHMAHGMIGQGISNAVTQAQLSAMLAEVVERGPDSLIGQLTARLETSLVDSAVMVCAARMFGGVIHSIPVVGPSIDEELGSAKNLGLTLYAVKGAILLEELFKPGEKKEISNVEMEERKRVFKEKSDALNAEYQYALTLLPPDKLAEELKKVEAAKFLTMLFLKLQLLPHLSTLTKRKLMQQAQHLFSDNAEMVNAVEQMLYPDPPYSIAARTMTIVGKWLVNVTRLVFCPLTGNVRQPLRDLKKIFLKDTARLIRFVEGVGELVGLVLYAGVYSVGRAVSDFIWNGILARGQAMVQVNKHTLSEDTLRVSSYMSEMYSTLKAKITSPASDAYQKVTHRAPEEVVKEYFTKLNAKVRSASSTLENEKPQTQFKLSK